MKAGHGSLAYYIIDAITIMFTEPLFTVVLSFVFSIISIGLVKMLLCCGLLIGMILTVQPPIIFGDKTTNNSTLDEIVQDIPPTNSEEYYVGVLMAMGCAVLGAFCNISINKCKKIRHVFQVQLT